jgi:anti-sigma factor RsiW
MPSAGTMRIELRCREVVALLAGYLSGELSPARAARLEAHLARCSPCLAYARAYRTAAAMAKTAYDGPEALGPLSEKSIAAILGRLGESRNR